MYFVLAIAVILSFDYNGHGGSVVATNFEGCTSSVEAGCHHAAKLEDGDGNTFAIEGDGPDTITFDEFPTGTVISNQYQDRGVIFTSDVNIAGDDANPTSPVLRGGGNFSGPIEGYFVKLGTEQPGVVSSLAFDVGTIDAANAIRIAVFDLDKNLISETYRDCCGIHDGSLGECGGRRKAKGRPRTHQTIA
eukprot:scaffold1267_cov171-Amphora_coffeaeformis.AAC.2